MTTSIAGRVVACALFAALAVGCSPSQESNAPAALPAARAVQAGVPIGRYIKHVVIIVQENRTFESMFAGWPGADAPLYGYAGTQKVVLRPIPFEAKDIDHLWAPAIAAWDNGKMDGFSNNHIGLNGQPAKTFPYSYLRHSEIAPYRTLASQYVLADHMFPTMFGGSFTAHLDLVSSTTVVRPRNAIVNLPNERPWGCDAPPGTKTSLVNAQREVFPGHGPFPCFAQFRTMAETLDDAQVSWKYYAPNILLGPAWSAFDAIQYVRDGPDWANNVISPQTRALTDPAAGALPSVAWVTPDYLDSDHPETGSDTGPSWVGNVVNAIGKSPDWKSTAIIVLWDDWGGWYDNVPPPQLDFTGLGIRVPCIIISPYARAGYVSHTQYEFGSVLKFIEQTFALPGLGPASLGYTDGRAASIVDSFDFTQAPRAFTTISVKYPPSYFLNRPQSLKVPDKD